MQIRKAGFSFLKISEIYITHMHGDHLFGIYGLLSTMSLLGRKSDVTVYAPAAFKTVLDSFLLHFGASFCFKINHVAVKCSAPEIIFETRKIEVLAFPLNHRIECYGFIFREKPPMRNVHKHKIVSDSLTLYEIARLKEGLDVVRDSGEVLINSEFTYIPYIPRSFAYCCDTAPFTLLPEYVRGVNLLYHEATFTKDLKQMAMETFHSTASDAAECAKSANAGKLLLGHLSARYKDNLTILQEACEIFPESEIAEPGKEYLVDIIKPD